MYNFGNIGKLLIILALASCTTQRKATKYFDQHGFQAAQYCAAAFPVRDSTIFIPGQIKVIHHTDTIPGDSIPCPEQLPGQPPAVVHCPPSIHTTDTIIRHDTTLVIRENTAKTAALQQQLTLSIDRTEKAENGRGNWRKRALWTWGILLFVGGGYILYKTQTAWFTNVLKNIHIK